MRTSVQAPIFDPSSLGGANPLPQRQASFIHPMALYDSNELDEEDFIVEGLPHVNFRHCDAGNQDLSFRRGFTHEGHRPPTRTTSERFREIEEEHKLNKEEPEKE